jgi:hypothetical protein
MAKYSAWFLTPRACAGMCAQQGDLQFLADMAKYSAWFLTPRACAGMCAQQGDLQFLADMAKYMQGDVAAATYPHAPLVNLIWWDWNPNSGDTGGIVQDDWLTVRARLIWLHLPWLNPAHSAHAC